jgi:hypothetical protein
MENKKVQATLDSPALALLQQTRSAIGRAYQSGI